MENYRKALLHKLKKITSGEILLQRLVINSYRETIVNFIGDAINTLKAGNTCACMNIFKSSPCKLSLCYFADVSSRISSRLNGRMIMRAALS